MYKTGKIEIIETLVDTHIFVRNSCNRDVEDGKNPTSLIHGNTNNTDRTKNVK